MNGNLNACIKVAEAARKGKRMTQGDINFFNVQSTLVRQVALNIASTKL